jgi:hypothetical protein
MAHRMAYLADKAHLDTDTLTRMVIFGSIGSGLLACAIGSFIFDVGRALAAW